MSIPVHVTVFTMTYNQRAKVVLLAEDLVVQQHPSDALTVVVLDDGGTDGTADALEAMAPGLPYRLVVVRGRHEADYRSAERWNSCIAAAPANTGVFVQVDDVRVRPDFVARHAAWHADGALTLVTGSKFEGDGITWSLADCQRGHLAGAGGGAGAAPWTAFWGASLSYSRALVAALTDGGPDAPFDSRMRGWGFHELEFAYRASAAGARLVYDPGVGVFHQNHGPVNDRGRGIDHAQQVAAGQRRNLDYLMAKHGLSAVPRW